MKEKRMMKAKIVVAKIMACPIGRQSDHASAAEEMMGREDNEMVAGSRAMSVMM